MGIGFKSGTSINGSFTEFRPPQWAEQIAIKKRGGIHFRLFSLLAPRVPTFRAANRGALWAHPFAETGWHLWRQPVSRTHLLI